MVVNSLAVFLKQNETSYGYMNNADYVIFNIMTPGRKWYDWKLCKAQSL